MRLARLYQPRNPLFWAFILVNALSSVISYLLHTRDFPVAVILILAGFALGNMVCGIGIAVRLLRDPGPEGGSR
ncbi:MAG: hypothetical protein KGZ43_12020 [Sulfuritalea sp.]|nr:hypothetical protein [Sulfuritalea sp.]